MEHPNPQKRDTVLQAALELFTERGFEGTSVPLIAERAGVGVGTIYRYFASKEALVNIVFQNWKTVFHDTMTRNYPESAPVRDRFTFLWQRMTEFATANPVAFAFLEMHHHTPYLDEASYTVATRLVAFLHGFIDDGVGQGLIRPMPKEALVALVFGAFVGLFKEYRTALDPALAAAAEACCWAAIATGKEESP
ncbi:MAG: Transcriptional regulator, TetR family [Symbiobacteriaceae bacterium]|jgi:AcrR family transcriptional regulator|nr:Transcriptional regulator, TetR family [Symbiobacteriaceae bacterium]